MTCLNPLYKAVYSHDLYLENKGLVEDLTKKIDQLERSEKKYKTLFSDAGDVIIILDENCNVLSLNKHAENILGRAKEEIKSGFY